MFSLFGLGNPGNRYNNTRHNIGFHILDHIAGSNNVPFKPGKGDYYFTEYKFRGDRILLFKPTTFMNLSGQAVSHVLKYFPVTLENILVIYDDFNLPFGTIRFRPQGSDGGHNGIRSIIYELQTEEFNRLRFGIGAEFEDAVQHVLTKFSQQESDQIEKIMQVTQKAVECWITEGIETGMNNYNGSYLEDNTTQ